VRSLGLGGAAHDDPVDVGGDDALTDSASRTGVVQFPLRFSLAGDIKSASSHLTTAVDVL
jgi:hypothetical protein